MVDRKIGVVLTADADPMRVGFSQGTASATDFAAKTEVALGRASAASANMAQSAGRMAQAVNSAALIERAHAAAADQFVRGLEREVSAAERQAAAFGRSRSALLEMQAAEVGATSSAAPVLARMQALEQQTRATAAAQRELAAARAFAQGHAEAQRMVQATEYTRWWADALDQADEKASRLATTGAPAAAASMSKVGMSAAATAAAMRMVPAQMTDIVVSLQGGQAPMTVLLQQGGQLKDMFGGIGPAARALGGYIMGMVTPFTVAAAGAAALGVAYLQGEAESRRFRETTILTGQAAGVTADQLQGMAQRIGSSIGSQGKAASVLNEVASTSRLAAADLEAYTLAAIRWEQVTGEAAADTVAQFVALGKDPVEASVKLNESLGHLTVSTYNQIKALQEAGRHTEAGKLAQQAFADAIDHRTPMLVQNIGSIEGAWKRVAAAVRGAWDFALSIGREDSLSERMGAQVELIENLKKSLDGSQDGKWGWEANRGAVLAKIERAQEELREMQRESMAAADAAGYAAAEQKRLASRVALDAYLDDDSRKTKAGRMADDLKEEQAAFAKATKDLDKNSKEYLSALEAHKIAEKNIREKYATKGGDVTGGTANELANAKSRLKSARDEAQLLEQQYQAMLRGASASAKLGESQKALNAVNEKLKATTDGTTRSRLEALKTEIESWHAQETATEALRERNKLQEDFEKGRERAIDAQIREVDTLTQKAIITEQEVAAYGLGKAAVEELTIARLRDQAAVLANFPNSEEEVARLNREIEARERLATATAQKEVLDANKKASEEATRDWKRATDQVGQSLTDAIFDGGKSGKELVERLFKTMILRPLIEPALQGGMNAVGSFLGIPGAPGVSAGGQNLGSLVSLANNAGKVWSGVSSALGFGAAASTGFGTAAAGMGLAGWGTLGTGAAAMTGAGLGTASAAAGLGLTGSALGTGAVTGAGLGLTAGGATLGGVAGTSAAATGAAAAGAGGVMGAIGAAAPYAALAFAAYSLLSGSFKGETRNGGQYGYAVDGVLTNNRRGTTQTGVADGVHFLEGPSGGTGDDAAIRTAIASTVGNINSILTGVGIDARIAGFTAGFESSEKGRGGVMSGGVLSSGQAFGESGRGDNYKGTLYESTSPTSLSPEEAAKALITDLYQVQIQALQQVAEDLPKPIAEMVKGLDAEAMSLEQAQGLVESISARTAAVTQFGAVLEQLPFPSLRDLSWEAKDALLQFAGGVDAIFTGQQAYLQGMYSEQERLDIAADNLKAALGEVGQAMPANAAAYRAQVEALDLNTEAGQRAYAVMMLTAEGFSQWAAAIEAQEQERAQERMGLEGQLLQLQGNTVELRRRELEALDPSNRALQERIWAIEDERAAIDTANAALQEQADLVERLAAEAQRLAGLRDAAGSLADRLGEALGKPGQFAAAREAEMWSKLAGASYEQQIDLAGELADIVLSRYQNEIQAAERLRDLGQSLASYLDSLRVGDLSPMTLGQRTAEAERQLMDTIARAQAGDEKAMGQVQSQLEASLRLWREYGASGADYQAAYARLTGAAGDLAERAQTDAERQLGVSELTLSQLEQLYGTATRAQAVMQAQYSSALQAASNEMAVLTAMASDLGMLNDVKGLLQGMPAGIAAALQPVLSAAMGNVVSGWYAGAGYGSGDQAGRDYWTGQLGSKPTADVQKDFLTALVKDWYKDTLGWAQPDAGGLSYWVSEAQRIGAEAARRDFLVAAGVHGSHRDGLWSVPFDGYRAALHREEIVLPQPEARRYRALEAMPDWTQYGRKDDSAVVSKLDAVLRELAQTRAENATLAAMLATATIKAGLESSNAVVEGVAGAIQQRQREDTNNRQAQRAGIYTTA